MFRRTVLASVLLLLLGDCDPAIAQVQSQCGTRDNVLKLLSKKYEETPVAYGVTLSGGLLEVLKSVPEAEDDTWSIIITNSQGISCLMAAGQGWKAMEQIFIDPET